MVARAPRIHTRLHARRLKPAPVKETPIVAWLTGAAVDREGRKKPVRGQV
jgi:hypothetical protein